MRRQHRGGHRPLPRHAPRHGGRARLGFWVPRSGALRARLRLDQGEGVGIGLMREEAWAEGHTVYFYGKCFTLNSDPYFRAEISK